MGCKTHMVKGTTLELSSDVILNQVTVSSYSSAVQWSAHLTAIPSNMGDCIIKYFINTKVMWDIVAERIAKVPNDVNLYAQNRTENLRLVNAHCFLKAKIHRNATPSLLYSCCAKSSQHTFLCLLAHCCEWVQCRHGFIPGQSSRFLWINK